MTTYTHGVLRVILDIVTVTKLLQEPRIPFLVVVYTTRQKKCNTLLINQELLQTSICWFRGAYLDIKIGASQSILKPAYFTEITIRLMARDMCLQSTPQDTLAF